MSNAASSKAAASYLVDPLNAPQPSEETGPGSHFGSTFDPAQKNNAPSTVRAPKPTTPPQSSSNPYRKSTGSDKASSSGHVRQVSRGSPREQFPDYRAEAFGTSTGAPRSRSASHDKPPPSYEHATSPKDAAKQHRRRTSSLQKRYPGDMSDEPLEIIRRDSKKAHRSPHLRKAHQPGPDTIDRLDPAIGGTPYHHEGPYDAALLSRNTTKFAPVDALKTSNEEALKATPAENIKDAVERHRPLDGVAVVPPGMSDRFGRTYNYEEGADLMREDGGDGPGYKRWADKDYSPNDLKGKSEPTYSLDQACRNHTMNDEGIEMTSGDQMRHGHGHKDTRDPMDIAGGQSNYVDAETTAIRQHDAGLGRHGSLKDGLKKRIGSLRKKRADS